MKNASHTTYENLLATFPSYIYIYPVSPSHRIHAVRAGMHLHHVPKAMYPRQVRRALAPGVFPSFVFSWWWWWFGERKNAPSFAFQSLLPFFFLGFFFFFCKEWGWGNWAMGREGKGEFVVVPMSRVGFPYGGRRLTLG